MFRCVLLMFASWFVLAALRAGEPEGGQPPPPPPPLKVETDPDVLRKVRKLIQSTLSEMDEEREKGWKGLEDMGNLAVPGLVGLFHQKATTPAMTRSILIALEDSKDTRAGPAMLEFLESPEPGVRRDAARALGDIGYKGGCAALEKRVADPKEDEDVRLFAASAGAKLGSAACFKALQELQKSPRPEVRSRATFALGKAGGKEQIPAIAASLSDSDESVREDAVEALRMVGAEETWPRLIGALNDEDRRVRGAAMAALRELTRQEIGNEPEAWRQWWKKKQEPEKK